MTNEEKIIVDDMFGTYDEMIKKKERKRRR